MKSKSNFFKYVFILFAIGIIIFAVYKIYINKEKVENVIEEVRRRRKNRS